LRGDVDAADRRASGTQTELLRVQYKVVTTRYEAMAAARELAAPGSAADDRPPGPVDPKLVVAQTYRDLADDEVRIDPALDEVAKEHLDIALDWAAGAERNAGGDTQRIAWSRGFQAEVFERLGNLKTQWSEGNPDWLTGRNGAFDDYRDAAHLYAKIGDKPNAERVQATRERLEAELGGQDRPK
jgi:hypothetical protein